MISVFDTGQVEDVIEGPGGLLVRAGGRAGDCGSRSIPRRASRTASRGWQSGSCAKGLQFVELPISGTSQQVAQGDGVGLVAGEKAAAEAARDVIEAICPRTYFMGAFGNGAKTKLAINHILGLNRAALAEGLVFAGRLGLPLEAFLEAAKGSAAYSQIMDVKGAKMIAQDFTPHGKIGQSAKDFGLIRDAATARGQALPLADVYAALMEGCIAAGEAELDNCCGHRGDRAARGEEPRMTLPTLPADGAPQPRKAATIFVLVTILLDVLALGISIPILPKLVESMLGGDTARAAILFGLFSTAFALMQLLFQPVLGALSDRFGRRPVILFSNLGLGLDYILMALAPNLWWLFVGRVISGIAASSFSTATAYITDVTPPDKRAEAYGLIGVAFGVGFVIGPAVGGLLGAIDPRLPLWVAAGFSLANAAYGYFVLPESLAEGEPRTEADVADGQSDRIAEAAAVASASCSGCRGRCSSITSSHNVFPSIFVLHAGYRFGWGEGMVGLGLAGFAVCSAIVQGR